MIQVTADARKLIAALDRLVDIADKEVANALEAALDRAVVIAKAGDFKDGSGSEHLRDMIRYSLEGKFSDDSLIGTFGAYAEYASYVEDGTPPHDIVAHGRVLRFPSSRGGTKDGYAYRRRVRHPGTRARHFMLPAVQSIDLEDLLDHALNLAIEKAGI